MQDEIIKCTGCEKCGVHLDESAGDDVDLGLCPECKYKKEETPPKKLYYCSFCYKESQEVEKTIAGPGVNICSGCIDLCVHLIRGSDPQTPFDLGLKSLLQERDKLQNDVHALSERVHGHEMQIAAELLLKKSRQKDVAAIRAWSNSLSDWLVGLATRTDQDGVDAECFGQGLPVLRDFLDSLTEESTESGS